LRGFAVSLLYHKINKNSRLVIYNAGGYTGVGGVFMPDEFLSPIDFQQLQTIAEFNEFNECNEITLKFGLYHI